MVKESTYSLEEDEGHVMEQRKDTKMENNLVEKKVVEKARMMVSSLDKWKETWWVWLVEKLVDELETW